MTSNDAKMDEFGAILWNVLVSIKNLETKLDSWQEAIPKCLKVVSRATLKLNSREHLNAISPRSGYTIEARTDHSPSAEMKRATVQENPSAIKEPIEDRDQRDERELGIPSPVRPTVQEYQA